MNQDDDKQQSGAGDSQVSAEYEKLADEKPPADLDRAVLREAARAVRADNRKGSFGAWFRPVAFMATVGLSLAIILDLSDTSIFSPPADLSIDTAAPTPVLVPAESAADAARKNRAQSAISEMKRQKRSVPAQSITMDAPEDSSDAVTESPPAEQKLLLITQPEAAAGADVQPTKLQCLEEERVNPELWWRCIESLRESVPEELLGLELEKLREAFPDFELPE